LPCHPEPPSFGERGTWARRANASRSLRGAKSHVWRASLWANCTRPAPLLPSARSAPTLRSVGMSCAETLAGEAIGGYRLKTPASQIASYSSQETELAALVSRKSFCILLWPLRGDQVSSGRNGKSRLPAICCLLSIKWPVGALILLFHHCRRAFARPGRVRDPSLRGHCRFHPMLESPCETSSQIHRRD
jgi:hypothetical protein